MECLTKESVKKVISFILSCIIMLLPLYTIAIEALEVQEICKDEYGIAELTLEALPSSLSNVVSDTDAVAVDAVDGEQLNSLTVINNDGSKTAFIFKDPIKFIDKKDKTVKFIDNSFKKTKKNKTIFTSYAYENQQNNIKLYLPEKIKDGLLMEHENFAIKMTPQVSGNTKGSLKQFQFLGKQQEVIEYANAFAKGYHLQYAAIPGGFKENIFIEKYAGINTFSFKLHIPGYCAVLDDYGISVNIYKNDSAIDAEPEYIINQPYVLDSYAGAPEGFDHVGIDNKYELMQIGAGEYILTMVIDPVFLESESTVYPVLIDPTTAIASSGSILDTYVCSGHTSSHHNDSVLRIGSDPTHGDMAIYVQNTFMWYFRYIRPENVTSVKYCTEMFASTVPYMNLSVFDSNNHSLDVSTVTYANIQSATGSGQSNLMWSSAAGGNWHFDVTNIAKKWLKYNLNETGKSASDGFIIKALDSSGYVSLRSANNAGDSYPYFQITYNEDMPVDSGIYYIKNVFSNQYLTARNSSNLSVISSPLNGSDKQQWSVISSGNGLYAIKPMSDLATYLQVKNGVNAELQKAVTDAPLPIGGYPYYTWWRIIKNGNGTMRLMPYISTIYALSKSSYSSETEIRDYYNNYGQTWIFEKQPTSVTVNTENVTVDTPTQLSASIQPTNAVKSLTWSIAPAQSGIATITSGGLLTATAVGSVDVIAQAIGGVQTVKTIFIKPIVDTPINKPFQAGFGYTNMPAWATEGWYNDRLAEYDITARNETVFLLTYKELLDVINVVQEMDDDFSAQQYNEAYWQAYEDALQILLDQIIGAIPVVGNIYSYIQSYCDLINIGANEMVVIRAIKAYLNDTKGLYMDEGGTSLENLTVEVRMLFDQLGKREICILYGENVGQIPNTTNSQVFLDLGANKDDVFGYYLGVLIARAHRISTYKVANGVTYNFPGW